MCTPKPTETSEIFVETFKRKYASIPTDEVRDIIWEMIKKNRREAEELQKIAQDILQKRAEGIEYAIVS